MKKRYVSIDIIKGIAMIMVILVHYAQNYQLSICKGFHYLQMGCSVFFVASGFAIMSLISNKYDGTLNSSNVRQFFYSRLKALAPGWYVAFIIIFAVNSVCILTTGKTLSFGTNRGFLSILCNLLFLHGLLPFCNNNVMPGGWYIGTTVILYFLTPVILNLINRAKNRRVFFIVSSLTGMLIWLVFFCICRNAFESNGFGYYLFLVHYPEYLLGIMLYRDFSESMLSDSQIKKCLPAGIGALMAAIALLYSPIPWSAVPSSWMTALAAYLILYYLLTNEKEDMRGKIVRILENYGKNSYCIYLMHAFCAWTFVQTSIKLLERTGISEIISFVILIPVTLILSYAAGMLLRFLVSKVNSIGKLPQ